MSGATSPVHASSAGPHTRAAEAETREAGAGTRTAGAVIYAGGGTGGHIFPNVAIAQRVAASSPGVAAHFVVSTRAVDAQALAGVRLAGGGAAPAWTEIPAQPFTLAPKGLVKLAWTWGECVRRVRGVIGDLRREHGRVALVATGGFVSAPAAQAARAEGIPVLLVNLDAVPGRANRFLAGRASKVLTSAPVEGLWAWERIAPVVRDDALDPRTPEACREAIGLDPHAPTLLITGGSQGAGSVNAFVRAFVRAHAAALQGWQVLHQTGGRDAQGLDEAYANAGVRAVIADFVPSMGAWWRGASLAIARSGAGNVAEAWASATPALFLPYPYHKDQHQRRNAQPLVDAGGAVVRTDRVDPKATLAEVGETLRTLLIDAPARDRMRQALLGLGPANGAQAASKQVLALLFSASGRG